MTDASLVPLLDVQSLDLEVLAAEARARALPERALLREASREIAQVEAAREALAAEVAQLEAHERALGEAVEQLARDIESAEVDRYSGKQKSRDEAATHEKAQSARRLRQSELEEEQMALLVSIEDAASRRQDLEERIDSIRGEAERATAHVREVEAEVAGLVSTHVAAKEKLVAGLPSEVLVAYERVRTQERKAGRGAAPLGEGHCGACRIKLPSLEYRRMTEAEAGALLQCPQCRRVLVRT